MKKISLDLDDSDYRLGTSETAAASYRKAYIKEDFDHDSRVTQKMSLQAQRRWSREKPISTSTEQRTSVPATIGAEIESSHVQSIVNDNPSGNTTMAERETSINQRKMRKSVTYENKLLTPIFKLNKNCRKLCMPLQVKTYENVGFLDTDAVQNAFSDNELGQS